jgi:DedD protein
MADSEDRITLKKRARRRLVGAIALAVFVAIVLPMVFDSEPKPLSSDINVQIPNPDNKAFKNQVVPVPPPAAGQAPAQAVANPDAAPIPVVAAPAPKLVDTTVPAKAAAKTDGKGSAPAVPPAPVAVVAPVSAPAAKAEVKTPEPKAVPAPAAQTPTSAPAAAAPAATTKAETAHGTWGVKLGAFSDAENVKRFQARLSAAGIKSTTEPVESDKGPQTRVWHGSFPNRAAAEHERDRLKKLGFAGVASEK